MIPAAAQEALRIYRGARPVYNSRMRFSSPGPAVVGFLLLSALFLAGASPIPPAGEGPPEKPAAPPDILRELAVPLVDLAGRDDLQTIVDREPGQYLGHPTTVLLEDGKTILCVYPKGHGKGPICLKKSEDGGRTWGSRLPVPENWATSLETPTIHRVVDKAGKKRLILFSGLYPIRMAVSEDDGGTWTPLRPVGD